VNNLHAPLDGCRSEARARFSGARTAPPDGISVRWKRNEVSLDRPSFFGLFGMEGDEKNE
jgi:hypothetical protein